MLAQVRSDVEKHYYDPTFRGLNLAARFGAADQRIRQASTIEEIFASVAQVVLELNDSHTYFVPPALTVQVKYGWQMQMVGDTCFVTQVTQGSDAAGQGLRAGDVVISVNGQSPTRKTLWKLLYLYHLLRPQPGLRVMVRSPGEEPRQIDIAAKVRQTSRVIDLTGADGGTDLWILIREAEKEAREQRALYNEIGETVLTWKLAVFDDYDRSVETGLKRARGRQALILDLRGNGGGDERALLHLSEASSKQTCPLATCGVDQELNPSRQRGGETRHTLANWWCLSTANPAPRRKYSRALSRSPGAARLSETGRLAL